MVWDKNMELILKEKKQLNFTLRLKLSKNMQIGADAYI